MSIAGLAKFIANQKWVMSRMLLQTFEILYEHTSDNIVRFDILFAEISVKNWQRKAWELSDGRLIGLYLIEIDVFI
jgi:hypothetical protein